MSAGKRYSPAMVMAVATVLALLHATPHGVIVLLALLLTGALIVSEVERQRTR